MKMQDTCKMKWGELEKKVGRTHENPLPNKNASEINTIPPTQEVVQVAHCKEFA